MRRDPLASDLRSLIDAPSPATLTLYREDGEAITSPVWFRLDGDSLEVVVAAMDHKLDHLRRDPRCILLIFEAVRPFRGLQVRASASISPDERPAHGSRSPRATSGPMRDEPTPTSIAGRPVS